MTLNEFIFQYVIAKLSTGSSELKQDVIDAVAIAKELESWGYKLEKEEQE